MLPASMADTPSKTPTSIRRWLFRLAWFLLVVSLFIPAPSGLSVTGPFGISALYVYASAAAWCAAAPGSAGALGFAQGAVLALALYSNIAFIYALYLRDERAISVAWKALLLFLLAVDASVWLLIPEFARLPAYWIWLAAMATLAIGYVVFGGASVAGGAQDSKAHSAASEIDRGEVPKFVWVLLAFTIFWIGVSAVNHAFPPDASTIATRDSLTGYVNDRAHVLSADEVSRLTAALQKFEAVTPSQIAIAIYPRAPAGSSIDDFTIRTAEHFPLGRAGLDTGAILFMFMDERAARLEVGYGLEGTLTDAAAHRILEANLAPAFALGAYFAGLDATLNAIFAIVQETYQQGGLPGTTTIWRKKLAAERPTRPERMWRAISEASLLARVGSTLLGALICVAIWSIIWHRSQFARAVGHDAAVDAAATDWGRFIRDIGRGVANLRAKRPFTEGLERFDFSTIWDTVRAVLWVVAILIPAAGVIIIAGGGEFGGAGALIHW
jgi:uncharacterized membrane protein YgcG